jgi:hypothetical protein
VPPSPPKKRRDSRGNKSGQNSAARSIPDRSAYGPAASGVHLQYMLADDELAVDDHILDAGGRLERRIASLQVITFSSRT